MLEASNTAALDSPAPDTLHAADLVQVNSLQVDSLQVDSLQIHLVNVLRDVVKRIQAELKFERVRNEALNFEIAQLKRWRFGSSAESIDSSTQAVLFDAIVADTGLEELAAAEAAIDAA